MIYLDNAATSFPKPRCVIRDLNSCLKKYCGNPGRSSHKLSLQASEAIYAVREEIAEHLSISTPENVVFTLNATYALNLAIKTLAYRVAKMKFLRRIEFRHHSLHNKD
jgi:selenocysteine lyase/cysteine desulfurase